MWRVGKSQEQLDMAAQQKPDGLRIELRSAAVFAHCLSKAEVRIKAARALAK